MSTGDGKERVMPRAIWSGSISFGLVNIPVKLFSAVRDKSVNFHMLHASDGARVHQKLVCPVGGEEVSRDDVVKGYEVSPGRYVILTGDELQAIAPEATRTIEIQDFVDISDIDPIYYQTPYYLLPEEHSVKPYVLLQRAMTESGRVGIGKFVMHDKGHLAALRPLDRLICLETMHFADEIVSRGELGVPPLEGKPEKREMEMADQLIGMMSGKFEPGKYHDRYREAVMDLVKSKEKGREVVTRPTVEESGKVVSLMAALEKSLSRAREEGKGESKKGSAS